MLSKIVVYLAFKNNVFPLNLWIKNDLLYRYFTKNKEIKKKDHTKKYLMFVFVKCSIELKNYVF